MSVCYLIHVHCYGNVLSGYNYRTNRCFGGDHNCHMHLRTVRLIQFHWLSYRHEEGRLAQLRSELDSLKREAGDLRREMEGHRRQVGEVSAKLKRKTEEKNRLKLAITELRNAQEEEETEVDTATYVRHFRVQCYFQ